MVVWYSWFWLKNSITSKLKSGVWFCDKIFVPRFLGGRSTIGPDIWKLCLLMYAIWMFLGIHLSRPRNFVISPWKIRIFCPKLAFLFILGRLIWCPVGGLVGGCGARAVSRKTPIYFMFLPSAAWTSQYIHGGGCWQCRWVCPLRCSQFHLLSASQVIPSPDFEVEISFGVRSTDFV